jgi:hypothetical protein
MVVSEEPSVPSFFFFFYYMNRERLMCNALELLTLLVQKQVTVILFTSFPFIKKGCMILALFYSLWMHLYMPTFQFLNDFRCSQKLV